MWSIIGYRILFELVATMILGLANLFITKINSLVLKLIVSVITNTIATFLVWRLTIEISFLNTTIERLKLPKLMRNITILIVVVLAINIYTNYTKYVKTINMEIDRAISMNVELRPAAFFYRIKNGNEEYNDMIENLKEETKKEVNKRVMPYYIGACLSGIIINLGSLLYVKRKIIQAVE